MTNTKTCGRCRRIRIRSAFAKMTRARDGLQAWCQECMNAYRAEWDRRRRAAA